MRITSLLAVLVAGLTVGCGNAVLMDEQGNEQIEQSEGAMAQAGICKSAWTCDSIRFYSTQAQCGSVCGSIDACYRDYACTGGCVCP